MSSPPPRTNETDAEYQAKMVALGKFNEKNYGKKGPGQPAQPPTRGKGPMGPKPAPTAKPSTDLGAVKKLVSPKPPSQGIRSDGPMGPKPARSDGPNFRPKPAPTKATPSFNPRDLISMAQSKKGIGSTGQPLGEEGFGPAGSVPKPGMSQGVRLGPSNAGNTTQNPNTFPKAPSGVDMKGVNMVKGGSAKPIKKAAGGAAKVRKDMMTPDGKIIHAMNKIRGC